MTFGQVGPLTAVLIELASVVASGALVGSFAIGTSGLVAGWPRRDLEKRVLTDGYVGGAWGCALAVIDLFWGSVS